MGCYYKAIPGQLGRAIRLGRNQQWYFCDWKTGDGMQITGREDIGNETAYWGREKNILEIYF